jgi:aminoglycoside phosphotransferase (APT) family kinase protein
MAVRVHAPKLRELKIVELGGGLDSTAYAAGDLVIRVAAAGYDVAREARLLEIVATRVPVPIPRPLFADVDAGVLGYERIPGEPLLGRSAPAGTAGRLGGFLRDLHAIDPGTVAGLVPTEVADPGLWLDGLEGPAPLTRLLDATRPRPSSQRVLAHADLGAEHILAQDGELTGIIDWSDAALTDPALDFARLYRDFGPNFLEEVLQAYGPLPDAVPRIEFFARCAALEDLAYGRAEYVANAERSLAWLFP